MSERLTTKQLPASRTPIFGHDKARDFLQAGGLSSRLGDSEDLGSSQGVDFSRKVLVFAGHSRPMLFPENG